MTYLVDANVLSEPTKPAPSAKVVAWLEVNEAELVTDPIVLGEMWMGILSLAAGRKRAKLEQWFEVMTRTLTCLAWDQAVSRRWARLVVELRGRGQFMPLLDSMIAGTALEHGLTVVTRNVRDFQRAGVKVVDPFV
jgi:predicted nucleic acid-binding protein